MIELVWDNGRVGTVLAPSGASSTVGDGADYTPDDLLAIAASAALMREVLEDTDRLQIPVLSFTATGCVIPRPEPAGAPPRVEVRVFMMLRRVADTARATAAIDHARASSPICRLLGTQLHVQSDIRALSPAASA